MGVVSVRVSHRDSWDRRQCAQWSGGAEVCWGGSASHGICPAVVAGCCFGLLFVLIGDSGALEL